MSFTSSHVDESGDFKDSVSFLGEFTFLDSNLVSRLIDVKNPVAPG